MILGQLIKLQYVYISTFIFWMAANIVAPFLSVFAIIYLPNATTVDIGIASMIFFVSFGVSVIILSSMADKIQGLEDDFYMIFFGFISRGIIFCLFIFADSINVFLFLHFLLGISRGFSDVSQEKIISKLSNKKLLSTSFGIRVGLVNFASAIGAGIGGFIIDMIGFKPVFIIIGCLTIFAGVLFLNSKKFIKQHL